MKTVSCIAVEDEPIAREILSEYIKDVKGLILLAMFENAKDALSFLQGHKVQLLFLDVHLPDLSGVDMFRSLNDPPKVIFATAHHEFAVDGFELNAVDYLLKPFSFQRFLKAVNKAFEQIHSGANGSLKSRVNLKSGKTFYSIERDKIRYAEGCGDYVSVKTDNKQILVHTTLRELEKILSPYGCLRIHRSYIVNLDRIDEVNGKSVVVGEATLPVGNMYEAELLNLLNFELNDNKA